MKKAELVTLATELGVDSDGLKSDLEDRISNHLNSNSQKYQNDERFQAFFSPSKSRRTAAKKPPPVDSGGSPKKQQQQDDGEGSEQESNDEDSENTHHYPLHERVQETRARVSELLTDAYEGFIDCSDTIRTCLSTIKTLTFVQILLEGFFLLKSLIPFTHSIHVIEQLHIHSVPDLYVLADLTNFWAPLVFWAIAGVFVPSLVAYYINFKRAKTPANKRQKNAASGGALIDPMVFAISRICLIHLLFNCKFCCHLVSKAAPVIHVAIGDLPYLSAIIAIIVTLYTN